MVFELFTLKAYLRRRQLHYGQNGPLLSLGALTSVLFVNDLLGKLE
jgi:hypothetical protein